MPIIFVSAGSNVERESNIRGSVHALRDRFGPLLLSQVYETEPVGFSGTPFYNLVVAFFTEQPPRAVADALGEIEAAHGRARHNERFAPRTLDLDLLLYGDAIVTEPGLQIPRPEIGKYAFVLEPLAEIAPDLRNPQTGRSYAEQWQAFAGAGAGAGKCVSIELIQ